MLILASLAALGAYASSLAVLVPNNSIERLVCETGPAPHGAILRFRGTILSRTGSRTYDNKTLHRYRLTVDEVDISRTSRPASSSALLDSPDDLPYGSRVSGAAFFRLPPRAQVPGQFDYREYLANDGVRCLARADVDGAVNVASAPDWLSVGRAFQWARRRLLARLEHLGLSRQGVIPAVLLGDRTALADDVRESFVRSGTMHLLAISGMNLAMVAALFLWGLRALGLGPRASSAATLAISVAYILIVGPFASVVRAGLMLAVFCLATLTDRPVRPLSAVSAAAAVMLVARPLHLYDAGFQMSFLSVLGIFYIGLPLARFVSNYIRRLDMPLAGLAADAAQVFAVSLGAGAAVTPLVACHFKVLSLVSPFANILLIPITWIMTVAGFAALGLSFLSAKAAALLALSASGAETALVFLSRVFAEFPCAYAYVAAPGFWLTACAYVWLTALAVSPRKRLAWLLLAGLLAANVLTAHALFFPAHPRPQAVVISDDRSSAAALFDGRGHTAVFLTRRGDQQAVPNLVVPYLLEQGVTRIDLLIETAGSDARVRDALRDRIGVGMVLRQRRFAGPGLLPPTKTESGYVEFGPGDSTTLPGAFEMEFHCGPLLDPSSPGQLHFEGLVARVRAAGRTAVLALDATDGCLAIVREKLAPPADVLCAPSYRGSPEALADLRSRLAPKAFLTDSGGALAAPLWDAPSPPDS